MADVIALLNTKRAELLDGIAAADVHDHVDGGADIAEPRHAGRQGERARPRGRTARAAFSRASRSLPLRPRPRETRADTVLLRVPACRSRLVRATSSTLGVGVTLYVQHPPPDR